jgi:hypothetical protein
VSRLADSLPLADLVVGSRFVLRLSGYLRYRLSAAEALAIVRARLAGRADDFLALAREAIYAQPSSPYRRLLAHAGCAYGDLETLVRQDGLEGALLALYRQGVFLRVAEQKGQQPVVRGSLSFSIEPGQLSNPLASADVLRDRSGSRGARAPVPINLDSIRDRAADLALALHARGGADWEYALWGVPGSSVMLQVLEQTPFSRPPSEWFSQVDPAASSLHPRYRWSARLQHLIGLLNGLRLPRPRYVSLEDPRPILEWMRATIRAGRTPHLQTFASSAVRLCQAALTADINLRGVQLTVTGEPITARRMATIRQAGATALPRAGSTEAGLLGMGCLAPETVDELHALSDLNTTIQPGPDGPAEGLPPTALLLTSIRRSARLILLNASLGDQAQLGPRRCGCPLEAVGWTNHLQRLRSFEKLNAGGISLLDCDVIRVLEEALPARFGGGATDYQLIERESESGQADICLLAHPRLGPLDETALRDAFLDAVGGGSGVERVMALQWRDAGLPRLLREPPHPNAVGKILHLHQERLVAR